MTERRRPRMNDRQRYIDLVFVSVLAGQASNEKPSYLVLERAYNLAEESWDLRLERMESVERRAMLAQQPKKG